MTDTHKQEPVAWVCYGANEQHDVDFDENEINTLPIGTQLYTSPQVAEPQPQRQWVGLTDEEIETEFGFIDELLRDCCYRIEAKLKEKNA